MKISKPVIAQRRRVRRLQRDFSNSALRNMERGTYAEMRKLERQLAKLSREAVELKLAQVGQEVL